MKKLHLFFAFMLTLSLSVTAQVVKQGAVVEKVAGGFGFTEGCAVDSHGNLFFSDIPAGQVHCITTDGQVIAFAKTDRSNGLAFDLQGRLLACETTNGRRLIQINSSGQSTVIVDRFNGKRFNSLNDLWIDFKGGVYFTDPRYGNRDNMEMDGEYVYYLHPDRKTLTIVCSDLIRPNGVIGSPDGKTLYVADHAGGQTYAYDIQADGTLSSKRLFAPEGADGVTVDNMGNVYLAVQTVKVFNPYGKLIQTIEIPETPTNLCIGGPRNQTLYITAQTSVYKIELTVSGVFSN